MWELAQVRAGDIGRVEEYLKEGYEPFAVSTDSNGFITIWLKREVMTEEEKKLRMEYYTNAFHSKPEHKQGAGRKSAKTAKG